MRAWVGSRALKFLQSYSVVDHNLRILWVGGDWDEFALENEGPAAVANRVLSTRIDDHIVGDETKAAFNALVRAVLESHNELKIDYRCDSSHHLRRFQLTVRPMKDDRALLVHDLRDVQTFSRPHLYWRYRHDADAAKCSFCNSVQIGDGPWIPSESLESHPSMVRYVVCPACAANIEEAIDAARNNRKPRSPLVNGFGP